MTEAQVIAIVGKPDDVVTLQDVDQFVAGVDSEWGYGTSGHLTMPTLGCIWFKQGRVDGDNLGYAKEVGVVGGEGEPPTSGMFSEPELRRLLRLIDDTNQDTIGFNPRRLIVAVNALQPLGKARALAALNEYCRVTDDNGRNLFGGLEDSSIFLILRALFDVPTNPGYMPRMYVGAPFPVNLPDDPKRVPRFPMVIVDDVPVLLVSGYNLGGMPEPVGVHLDYFQKYGTIRSNLLVPSCSPVRVLSDLWVMDFWPKLSYSFADSPRFAGNDYDHGIIVDQIFRMLNITEKVNLDLSWRPNVDSQWRSISTKYRLADMRWNAALSRYTFADGSFTADPLIVHYPYYRWAPDISGMTVHIVVHRNMRTENDFGRTSLSMDYSGRDLKPLKLIVSRLQDASTFSVLDGPETPEVLGGGDSSVGNDIDLKPGTKIRVDLMVGDKLLKGPIYSP